MIHLMSVVPCKSFQPPIKKKKIHLNYNGHLYRLFQTIFMFFLFITNHYTLEVKLTVCSEKPACISIQPLACDKSTFFLSHTVFPAALLQVHQVGWMLFVDCNFQTVPQTLDRIQIWSFMWFSECDCSRGLLQCIQTHLILLKPGAFAFILRHYRRGTQRDFNILWFLKKKKYFGAIMHSGASHLFCVPQCSAVPHATRVLWIMAMSPSA